MAANKVKFLTGANSDVNSVAKVAGQILFAVDSNNYGYIYYDKDNSTRINMSVTNNIQWTSIVNKPQLVQGGAGTTSTTNYIIQLYDINGAAIAENNNVTLNGKITIPAASSSVAGLVTTTAQTLAGEKTFTGNIVLNAEQIVQARIKRKQAGGGGWAYEGFSFIGNDNADFAHIGVLGQENTLTYMYIGSAVYNADTNLRIYPNGDVTAKTFKGNLSWSYLTNIPQIVQGAVGTTATDKYTIQLYDISGAAIPANTTDVVKNGILVIPAATASIAGLITTGAQTLAGVKTFSGGVTVSASGGFNYTGIQAGTSNADRVVWFSDDSAIGKPVYDNDFKYNPSTNTLKLVNITASGAFSATGLTLSSGDDSTHSTETATLKVTGGASISMNLSAKSIRIDNGVTTTTEGFKLIYNSTDKCLEFQFGN